MFAGFGDIRFSELFADNRNTHGFWFCWELYVVKGKMAEWEFWVWETGWKISQDSASMV